MAQEEEEDDDDDDDDDGEDEEAVKVAFQNPKESPLFRV